MLAKDGYKISDAGIIPDDWEVKKLHILSEKVTVGIASAATHAYRDRGVIMFRNQNIKAGFLDDRDILYISPEYEKLYRGKRLKAGDLLTARTGYPGTTCIVPEKYEGSQSFTTLITRPKPEAIRSEFLSYYINSEKGQSFFEANQIGGGQKNVNAGTLKLMPIPIPPTKEEQTAIATALSDADALISSLEKLIAKKRNIKQGAMQQLLQPKEGWEVKKLGDCLDKVIGGGTPARHVKEYWGQEIPWVTVKDFATFDPYCTQEYITRKGLQNSAANLIPRGALITSTRMGLGKAVLYRIEVSINQDLKALFPSSNLNVEFLYYWFQNNADLIANLGSGSTVMGISVADLKNIDFLLPDLPTQLSIVGILTDLDKEITEMEKKLEKIKQIKQGMMQQLLTGKIRLV